MRFETEVAEEKIEAAYAGLEVMQVLGFADGRLAHEVGDNADKSGI